MEKSLCCARQVSSWGDWTWDPANVKTIAQLPGTPNDETSGYAAITMSYEEHLRDGKPYFCARPICLGILGTSTWALFYKCSVSTRVSM